MRILLQQSKNSNSNLLSKPIHLLHFTWRILNEKKSFDCTPKLMSFSIRYIPRSSLTRIIIISLELLEGFEWIINSRISQDILYAEYHRVLSWGRILTSFLSHSHHLYSLSYKMPFKSHTSLVPYNSASHRVPFFQPLDQVYHGIAVMTLKSINGTRARPASMSVARCQPNHMFL